MQSTEDIFNDVGEKPIDFLHENIIKETRRIIKPMTELERFQKAKAHILDSLAYKHPRPKSESKETSIYFKFFYKVQVSSGWQWLLFILGYVFMYLVIIDNESYSVKIGLQASILIIFWTDSIIVFYCRRFDSFKRKNNYSKFFYGKILIILLMTIDLIVFICLPCYDSRPIRPFRILRAFVPILFDPQMRKSLFALASAYKDVLVYLIFFTFIICGWALIGSRALSFDPNYHDTSFPQSMDPYKNQFSDLGKMIFVVYVTATYDSYPDNQILGIQNYQPNYIYFIVFIFLNMFLFSSIPGTLVYLKFRETRSKIILVDQIRQQHSLILAFVTLAEHQKNVTIQKLIKFLLYLYKYKIRYIEYITDICLRLDDNNNRSIQVNQFMQLSKILLQNSAMLPPTFEDVQMWISFRKFVNTKFNLKFIINHWIFQLIVSIIIILSFINAIFLLFYNSTLAITFDTIFIWTFLVELSIRIIAIGPQNFFNDRWNNVDTALVLFGIIFYFVPDTTGADSVVRMSRIFRIASLLRLVSHSHFLKDVKLDIFDKIKNIFTIILQIMPIILKFFPLFLFFFYIFSIFGMQVFYNSYDTAGSPAYNNYSQFSSFRTFIQAHYIMVQVLTEAGWSQVAFDHGWRNANYYGYVMVYFCFMHITITYIVATLIRGIFWQVFFTVNSIFSDRNRQLLHEQIRDQVVAKKTKQLAEIQQIIDNNQYFEPNTIIKRQIIQNKLDIQIFQKLEAFYQNADKKVLSSSRLHSSKNKRTEIVGKLMENWQASRKDVELSDEIGSSKYFNKSQNDSRQGRNRKMSLHEIDEVDDQDFQSQIQELFQKVILDPEKKYIEIMAYPKIFTDYLNTKFRKPTECVSQTKFDLRSNPLGNAESMYYHTYEIHALLNIQTSKRQQKGMIIDSLLNDNIITDQNVEKLLRKKLQEKIFHIDTNGTLRKLFLSETSQDLVNKFEVQYFSDLYGYSFKHINKMTLEPLLKFEATLTYSLRNILRYPQINNTQFFEMFTHIEDQLSNKLLKRGSLFKFVYKIDHESDIWFAIEYKRQQQMRIHFIKTGIWAYTKEMVDEQSYYARDVFNWDVSHRPDRKACEQYMKRFYQSFQSLAFSLLNQKQFFVSNPSKYIYDLYVQSFDASSISRFKTKSLQISKIMVVILTKEQDRMDINASQLRYPISDIVVNESEHKHHVDFTFDESDNQIYDKLKNIAAMDFERIVESEGLPFSYIVNLMAEIKDIIKLYGNNFVYQIQKVLNDQYETKRQQKLKNKQDNKMDLLNVARDI